MTKKYKCRVEYLESSGTQYIDTGLNGKNNIDFDYKCIFTNLDGTAQCVGGNWSGAGTSTVSLYFGLIRANGNFAYHYDGTQNPVVVMNTTVQDTPYSIQGHMWVGEQYMVINGTKSSVGTISSTFTSSLNMYLFGINNNGLSNPAYMKLYYCKIYDNGVLVRDFIPVLDNSGRPAMYDQVSGQLFYNQGSGEFTYGRQIIPVEYLESTGTQYIDTGVIAKSGLSSVLDFEYTALSGTASMLDARSGDNRFYLCHAGKPSTTLFFYYGYGSAIQSSTTPAVNTRYLVETSLAVGSQSMKVNGTTTASGSSSSTYNLGANLYLFGMNYSTPQYLTSAKLYGCKIMDGSTLVRDYVPAIDENNTPFMFDKVHNTVYLNAGTGQFKVGPNVEKTWGGKRLRKKLALMLATFKKKRKYYCEVEYLKSSGSTTTYQWIDTGFKPTTNTKIRCILACADMGTANNITFYGARTGAEANTNFGLLNYKATSKIRFDRGNYNNSGSYGPLSANTFYEIVQDKNKNYVDGVSAPDSTGTFSDVNYNIFIFGINDNGTYLKDQTQGAGVWKEAEKSFKLFQIYDNGVLVRDFIPVLDWNMTPCMYDRVTEQLFYNQGTGDFVAGREIHYVDYLESTGTQYIDTGIKPNNNTSVEIDYQLTQATQTRAGLFGALNMSGSNQGRVGSILSPTNSYLEHGYGSGNDYWQQGLPDTNRHLLYQKKNEVYFDGTLIHTFNTATFNLVINAYLGNFLYTNYTPAKAKYYGSRWWDGNTLVRDYKPAIDENGVCFWFDRVTHAVFLNAGTGVFSYPARETEYTANAGTPAYIDLGAKYKSSMSIRGKFTRDSMGASGSVLLVTTTTTNPVLYFPALNANATVDRYVWRRPGYNEQNYYLSFDNYPLTEEAVLDAVNDTLTVNGNLVQTGMIAGMNGYSSPYESSSNMYMFSIAGNYAGDGKVYYLKITDGTTPVFDLIPAYKDGEAGFYNKITGVFYGNVSTNANAALTAGKIVEPRYE